MDKASAPFGRYLRVDLSTAAMRAEVFPDEVLRQYPGGSTLGARILYDETTPDTQWSDPENRVIVASGPLGGTRVNGSGTISVITLGALTGGPALCQANGFMGAFLRQNGYDGLILQGAAPTWSYLYIHDGAGGNPSAELRDATHLAGVDTWELIGRLAAELDLPPSRLSVFGIGPAGENLVRFAALVGDRGHVGGHNGTGAVLGAKRLKAIVVQRGAPVPVADADGLAQVAKELFERVNREGTYRWGTLRGVARGADESYGWLPIKNYTTNEWDITPEQIVTWDGPYLQEHLQPQRNNCWACRFTHCTLMTVPEGHKRAGYVGEEPEYEQFAAFGPVIDNKDSAEAFYLANRCDRLGFENNEMGWLIGFCMECYEKGLISKEQFGGLELTWGNTEATDQLMERIAHRQGIGDLLAEGVMRAAQRIGGEALHCAVYTTKGNSPRGHDHRARWAEMFDTSLSDTGTMELGPMFNMPADSRAQLGVERLPGEFEPEEVIDFAVKTSGAMFFEDSLGTCRFNTQTDVPYLVRALNAATGWDVTIDEALTMGRRTMHLLRALNLLRGATPEQDRPSPRYGSTPVDGPVEGISIQPHWEAMVQSYYRRIGWDSRGWPTRETLERVGLADVADDLDR